MSVNSLGYKLNKNPIAQSFYIDEPTGVFITKIDLYFKKTFTATANLQLPVSLHLRPMVNGVPSDTAIVPGSTVYVEYNEVNVSTNATSATTFEFEEPIFLTGLTDYAMVVYAESPEYEIYISEIDEQIIGSASARVNKNPSIGSLFYSQNGATFSANQKQDLKFDIYRAKFDTTVTGAAFIENASVPRKLLNNNSIQTFSGDSSVRVFSLNHGLQVNDTVSIEGANAVGGISAATLNADHTVTKIDASGFEFEATTAADSDEVGGGNSIISTQNLAYSIVYPNVSFIKPLGTNMYASYKGTSGKSFAGNETPYTVDGSYSPIRLNGNNTNLNHNYVVAADSIADAEIAVGAKTAMMKFDFTTNNEFVSPMVDLQRTSLTLIDNVIDKQDSAATNGFNVPMNFVNETEASGGTSAAKHITSVIELGQEAVGLKVLLTAHRPKEADFKLYYRTGAEGDLLQQLDFTEVSKESTIPSDQNPRIYREYEYLVGGQGGNVPAFTKFQLKIVMNSTNSARVPIIKDLRAIALGV